MSTTMENEPFPGAYESKEERQEKEITRLRAEVERLERELSQWFLDFAELQKHSAAVCAEWKRPGSVELASAGLCDAIDRLRSHLGKARGGEK